MLSHTLALSHYCSCFLEFSVLLSNIVLLALSNSLSCSFTFSLIHSIGPTLTHSLSRSFTHIQSRSLTYSLAHSVSISPSQSRSLANSVSSSLRSLIQSIYASLTHSLGLSLTVSVSRSLSRSRFFDHSQCLSLALIPSLMLSNCHSDSLMLFLTHALYHFHSLVPAPAHPGTGRGISDHPHTITFSNTQSLIVSHSLSQPICLRDRESYKTKYERKKVIKERE